MTLRCLSRRVNIAGLAAILRKVCLQSWPWAGVWEPEFWEGSHHSQKTDNGLPMPELSVCIMWFILNTYFFFPGGLEF